MSEGGRSTSQLLASLQARKDTLEAKLHDKTQELKSLCIKEAELTGFLPPEIPLEPGESPPQFRRRVGTAFTYPENLINNNNVKTKEEETLAALELEYKIQRDIADAALGMANDSSLSKAVRRKHRQVYQKIQRRLNELESKLHHLQQTVGHTGKPQQFKQRKKPRPPLDNDAENQERSPILHNDGISLSPIGPIHQELEADNVSHHYGDSPVQHIHREPARVIQGVWHSVSYNGLSPVSRDVKMYHRHAMGYHHHHHHHHHYATQQNQHYSTLPTTVELGYMVQRERLDQGRSLPGYWLRYETDLDNFQYNTMRPAPMHQAYQPLLETVDCYELKDSTAKCTMAPSTDTSVHAPGNFEKDRFGSLDRRYARTTSHSSSSPCLEAYGVDDSEDQGHKLSPSNPNPGYYATAIPQGAPVDPAVDPRRYCVPPHMHPAGGTGGAAGVAGAAGTSGVGSGPHGGGALLPSQTYPEHSLGVSNQGLTRTQSLGSVETSASGLHPHKTAGSDTRTAKEQQRLAPSTDTLMRKQKEKEWYETSLDSAACSAPAVSVSMQRSCPPSRRPSGHSLSEMKILAASQDVPSMNHKNESVPVGNDLMPSDLVSDVSSDLSRSSSNVSSEQHTNYQNLQTKCQETVSPENFDTVVPFESPKNHMVVQAGKWQPYREVTKPFEMADFYKYSTKFRKQVSNSQVCQRVGQSVPPLAGGEVLAQPAAGSGSSLYHSAAQGQGVMYAHAQGHAQAPSHVSPSSSSPTPQQKGVYQPLQPMTCQPLQPLQPLQPMTCQPLDPAGAAAPHIRNRVVMPGTSNAQADGKRPLGNTNKSLADAFSTEMLEWYQDQSVPRSATLV